MRSDGRPKDRRRSGGRRRSRSRQSSGERVSRYPPPPPRTCVVCGQNIQDVYSAVAYGEEQEAAHFECVLQAIKADRNLKQNEKVCYVGSGTFAVVRTSGSGAFVVAERIRYEDEINRPEWRRELRRVNPA